MRLRSLALFPVLSGLALLPLSAVAAEGEIGGRSAQPLSPGEVRVPDQVPILVDLGRRETYAIRDVRPVPGVDIRIEGAREVIVHPDGTVEVLLGEE